MSEWRKLDVSNLDGDAKVIGLGKKDIEYVRSFIEAEYGLNRVSLTSVKQEAVSKEALDNGKFVANHYNFHGFDSSNVPEGSSKDGVGVAVTLISDNRNGNIKIIVRETEGEKEPRSNEFFKTADGLIEKADKLLNARVEKAAEELKGSELKEFRAALGEASDAAESGAPLPEKAQPLQQGGRGEGPKGGE